jgi:alanine racemase
VSRNLNAYISQSAIRHNFLTIKNHATNQKIMAMIKANAYGHGLISTAQALSDADAFGVASIEEALLLLDAKIQTPIVLMEGFFHADELELIQNNNLSIVLHHPYQLEHLLNYKKNKKRNFNVWVKVNLGMNRLGFEVAELDYALKKLNESEYINVIGLMGHFPEADNTNCERTKRQCEQFSHLTKSQNGEHSLANSAGILAWPSSHHQWVRPGLALYGATPFPGKTGLDFDLKPAMSLTSEIISIRELEPYARVGYGGAWQNGDKKRKIAIIAAGYGDGYPWHAQSGTPVLVNSQHACTIGRVSMDMLAIDIDSLTNVNIGDQVVLWGSGLPIEHVSKGANTIPYELFCRLTDRVNLQITD